MNFSFNLLDICQKLNPAVPRISPDVAEQHHLDVCYSLKGFAAASVSGKSNHGHFWVRMSIWHSETQAEPQMLLEH